MAGPTNATRIDQAIRAYIQACNDSDAEEIAATLHPDATHYYPYLPIFVGAMTIATNFATRVKDNGICVTVGQIVVDADRWIGSRIYGIRRQRAEPAWTGIIPDLADNDSCVKRTHRHARVDRPGHQRFLACLSGITKQASLSRRSESRCSQNTQIAPCRRYHPRVSWPKNYRLALTRRRPRPNLRVSRASASDLRENFYPDAPPRCMLTDQDHSARVPACSI
jgi:hypothetical protein